MVFIDGLHQSEYVLNDINNSIVALSQGGKIFMDDILPLTYDEQLKIPKKHYYEKDILKYGEPWTGDVWKVLYYILKNYSEHIDFSYYFHIDCILQVIYHIQLKENFTFFGFNFIN